MKIFLFVYFLLASSLGYASSLEEDIQEAFYKNCPLVVISAQEGSCPWSALIKEKLLKSSAFLYALQDKAIVHVTEGEPGILLLDPRGKEFANLQYDGSDPERFAGRILGTIEDFESICIAIAKGLTTLEDEELKALYAKAGRLSDSHYRLLILTKGVQCEKGVFFHLEKYGALVQKVKLKSSAIRKLKEEILKKDPNNQQGAHREIAWLDFRKKAEEMSAGTSATKVIAPLLSYLKKWADPDEKWKIEMKIAEFLFAKEVIDQAKEYAKKAYADAPVQSKDDVHKMASYMGFSL